MIVQFAVLVVLLPVALGSGFPCRGVVVIDRCFWVIPTRQSASGTNNICKRHDGTLATFSGWESVLALHAALNGSLSDFDSVWIGAKHSAEASDDEPSWIDYHSTSDPLTWTHWQPHEPKIGLGRACAMMFTSGSFLWKSAPCTDMLPGICHRKYYDAASTTLGSTNNSTMGTHRIKIANYDNFVIRVRKRSEIQIQLHSNISIERVIIELNQSQMTLTCENSCNRNMTTQYSKLNFTFGFTHNVYECDCDVLRTDRATTIQSNEQTTVATVLSDPTTVATVLSDPTTVATVLSDPSTVASTIISSETAKSTETYNETSTSPWTYSTENENVTTVSPMTETYTENVTSTSVTPSENSTATNITDSENVTETYSGNVTTVTPGANITETYSGNVTTVKPITNVTETYNGNDTTVTPGANITETYSGNVTTVKPITNVTETYSGNVTTVTSVANITEAHDENATTVTPWTDVTGGYSNCCESNCTVCSDATSPSNTSYTSNDTCCSHNCTFCETTTPSSTSQEPWLSCLDPKRFPATAFSNSTTDTQSTMDTNSTENTNSTPDSNSTMNTNSTNNTNSNKDTNSTENTNSSMDTNSTNNTNSNMDTNSSKDTNSTDNTNSTPDSKSTMDPNSTSPESNSTMDSAMYCRNSSSVDSKNSTSELNSNCSREQDLCNCTDPYELRVEEYLNSTDDFITLWISWAQGLIQVGVGAVLGDYLIMETNSSVDDVQKIIIYSTETALWEIDIIKGQWCSWSFWSKTTNLFSTNQYSRTRSCDCPKPSNGGDECPGDSLENLTASNIPQGVNCQEPAPVTNAYRILGDMTFASITTYECYDTFDHVAGYLMRQCNTSGEWYGDPPQCHTNCGHPPDFHGAYLFSLIGTTFGDVATYRCLEGFETTSEGMTSVCEESGWKESNTICLVPENLATIPGVEYTISPTNNESNPFQRLTSENVTDCTCYRSGPANRTTIKLDFGYTSHTFYDFYEMSVTFPNSSDAMPVNFTVKIDETRSSYKSQKNPKQGEHYEFSPKVAYGSRVTFTGGFRTETPMTLCNIVIRGRPRKVECGRPGFSFAKQYTIEGAKEASYQCAPGFYNRGGDAESYCSSSRDWSGNNLRCTEDPNLTMFLPNETVVDDIKLLSDDNDSTCTNSSATAYTFTLNALYEVSEVVVTVSANITWESMIILVKNGERETTCRQANTDFPTVRPFACKEYPIGSTVVVKSSSNVIDISICEIRIFGTKWTGKAVECRRQSHGMDYKGQHNVSVTGQDCLLWTQCEHSFNFADLVPADVTNQCRNPNGLKGPWCFTDDCEKTYCPIAVCNQICSDKDGGFDYIGRIDYTVTGKECRNWYDVKAPQPFIDKAFPDSKRKDHCRNPGRSYTNIWCYVDTATAAFEECYIPSCPLKAEVEEFLYFNRTTEFNETQYRECFKWQSTWSSGKTFKDLRLTVGASDVGGICGSSSHAVLFCQSLGNNSNMTKWTYLFFDCYIPEEEISSSSVMEPSSLVASSAASMTSSETSIIMTSFEYVTTSGVISASSDIFNDISSSFGDSSTSSLESSTVSTSSQTVSTSSQTVSTSPQTVTTSSQTASTSSQTVSTSSSIEPTSTSNISPSSVNSTETTAYTPFPQRKICPCKCLTGSLKDRVELLRSRIYGDLIIDPTILIKTRSKKFSAWDSRATSATIGSSAMIIMIVYFGFFMFNDLISLLHHLKVAITKFRKGVKDESKAIEMT